MGNAYLNDLHRKVFFYYLLRRIIRVRGDTMSLMDQYSYDEKRAVIAFLNSVITADLEVQIDELNLVWMLSRSINVDLNDVEKMTEEEFNQIMLQLSEDKLLEVIRMGVTLLNVDKKHKGQEENVIKSMLGISKTNYLGYQDFYLSMNVMTDLTPLDQVVLIILAHYMAEADGIYTQGEVEMLLVLCNIVGVNMEEVPLFKIPKDSLYRAVFSMSAFAVRRLVEELLLISIADFKIAEQEYEFIFPILSHFHLDFEDVLKSARYRLNAHIEYYELFQSELPIS